MSRPSDRQLAAWEAIAEGWQSHDDHTTVRRCLVCGLGIYLLTDVSGRSYLFTREQIMAQTVLHLRNYHADLDPDRPVQTL